MRFIILALLSLIPVLNGSSIFGADGTVLISFGVNDINHVPLDTGLTITDPTVPPGITPVGQLGPGAPIGVQYGPYNCNGLGGTWVISVTLTPPAYEWTATVYDASRSNFQIYVISSPQVGSGTFTFTYYPPYSYECPCDPCPCQKDSPAGAGNGGAQGTASPNPSVSPANVNYGTGAISFQTSALTSGGFNKWGETRSFSSGRGSVTNVQGQNWSCNQRTQIIQSGANEISVLVGGKTIRFSYNGTVYTPLYSSLEKLTHVGTQFVLMDTKGYQTTFNDFTVSPVAVRGLFTGLTPPLGPYTLPTYDGSGRLTQVQTSGGGFPPHTDTFLYSYNANGLVSNVQYQTYDGFNTITVRQVDYEYYTGVAGEFGENGELKRVTVKDGQTTPAIIDQTYYRYYRAGETAGFVGALKYVLNPRNYGVMVGLGLDPTSATVSNTTLAGYADDYYEYDSNRRVSKVVTTGSGCSCQGGAAQATVTYAYTTGGNSGANNWFRKTTETWFDMNLAVVYTKVVYTNDLSEPVFEVFTGDSLSTYKQYKYDTTTYALIEMDEPSAIASYTETNPALSVTLNATAGLIRQWTYAATTTSTTVTAGDVAGYLKTEQIKQGSSGTAIPQRACTYITHTDGSGVSIYLIDTDTRYNATAGSGPEATKTVWNFSGPPFNQPSQVAVSRPLVSATQNGPALLDTISTALDNCNRPVWIKNEDGYLTYIQYDDFSGAISKRIEDADSTRMGEFTYPPPWNSIGTPLHLITLYAVDGLGRTKSVTDPNSHTTYTVYNDATHEVRTYPGWTGTAPTGPTRVEREDRFGSYVDSYSMTATPTTSGGKPTGLEPVSGLQTLTRTYRDGGNRDIWSRDYYNISMGYSTTRDLGTASANYNQTSFWYDSEGNRNKIKNGIIPGGTDLGTIYRTVYDTRRRILSTWVGTNDTPPTGEWSPSNNASPSNMVMMRSYIYDGGGAGDNNLTQISEYPTASPTTNRIRLQLFDWRDRLVLTKDAYVSGGEDSITHRPIMYYDLDNLGRNTGVSRFDGDGVVLSSSGGVPNKPASGKLRAYTAIAYDDQDREYQRQVFSVDQATGALSATALTTASWYNQRSLLVKRSVPGGLVLKSRYDTVGRLIKAQQSDGGGDANWTHALDAAGDVVFHQEESTYDGVGNLLMLVVKDRNHDETQTNDLGNQSTIPLCRTTYRTKYYDNADRRTDEIDVGTNGGSAFSRLASPPVGSDLILRTTWAFTPAGFIDTVTDPRGTITKTISDALGQVTESISGYNSGTPGPQDNANLTTDYTYDFSRHVVLMTAQLPGSTHQSTKYVYGVSSNLFSNDLLAQVQYPDKSSGDPSLLAGDRENYTYNVLGECVSKIDGNNTTHTFTYDLLGRRTSDAAVLGGGSGVDASVLRLETAYDTGGRAYLFTSYNATSGGTVVNQVQRAFSGLGQMITEYQQINGVVNTGTSPKVQYTYTAMSGGVNNSRITKLTYPNNRILRYEYSVGNDANISRVSFLADDNGGAIGTHLEEYSYMGRRTVVRRAHPQPGVDLTFVKLSAEAVGDAGDQYTGFDRFGRLVDQRWIVGVGPTHTDRFQYGYDRAGEKLYKNNLVAAVDSELYHSNAIATQSSYDLLGHMSEFRRGTLTASGTNGTTLDKITTATDPNVGDPIYANITWTVGALDWKSQINDGTTDSHTINKQNQVTVTGLSAAIGYDNEGNLTTQTSKTTNTWDAWNRAVSIRGTTYVSDALGRRVKETIGANSRSFYHSGWRVIETRSNALTRAYEQFVYSLRYIDEVVLRDRDADNNAGTGALGITGSGLEQRVYIQQDREFSVTALLSTAGVVLERCMYDPFGSVSYFTAAWASATDTYANNIGFTGRWQDSTGMDYFRARMYDPVLGRFISRDRLGYVDGMSMYAGYFVPKGMDPSGLKDFEFPCGKLSIVQSLLSGDRPENGEVVKWNMGVGSSMGGSLSSIHTGITFTPNGKCCCKRISFIQVITRDDNPPPGLPKTPRVDVTPGDTDPYYGAELKNGDWQAEPGEGRNGDTSAVGNSPCPGQTGAIVPATTSDDPTTPLTPGHADYHFQAEVCAICIDTGKVIGCATWGYSVPAGSYQPQADPLGGGGDPSQAWKDGVKAWNAGAPDYNSRHPNTPRIPVPGL